MHSSPPASSGNSTRCPAVRRALKKREGGQLGCIGNEKEGKEETTLKKNIKERKEKEKKKGKGKEGG
ncbi:hypothetical protein E2C01_078420 [Portunus trituberculatus]|uniref:Uncharacterized protein n=1 Tax=Portunus trituberculatus TaxID=210409 RepID=A0A5B7IMV4_PORTR|nr:hypothetical protein [Portunus trituberculatus]